MARVTSDAHAGTPSMLLLDNHGSAEPTLNLALEEYALLNQHVANS